MISKFKYKQTMYKGSWNVFEFNIGYLCITTAYLGDGGTCGWKRGKSENLKSTLLITIVDVT